MRKLPCSSPALKRLSLGLGGIPVYGESSQMNNLEPLAKLTNLTQLSLDLSSSQVNNLEPLAKLTNLTQLSLGFSFSQVNNLEPLLKLSPQTLELTLTTEQRLSLKTIPKDVTSPDF